MVCIYVYIDLHKSPTYVHTYVTLYIYMYHYIEKGISVSPLRRLSTLISNGIRPSIFLPFLPKNFFFLSISFSFLFSFAIFLSLSLFSLRVNENETSRTLRNAAALFLPLLFSNRHKKKNIYQKNIFYLLNNRKHVIAVQ